MCRKLETETEKVLPFYASSLAPEEDDDVAAAMQEAPSEPLAEVNKRSPPPSLPLATTLWNTWAWATVIPETKRKDERKANSCQLRATLDPWSFRSLDP